MSRRLYSFAMLAVLISCKTVPMETWANKSSAISRNSVVYKPISELLPNESFCSFTLIGIKAFRYGESRSVLSMQIPIDSSSDLFNKKDILVFLKIVGDSGYHLPAIAYISNNNAFIYLTLNRFYSIALGVSSVLMVSADNQYLFKIPPFNEGFVLENLTTGRDEISIDEITAFSKQAFTLALNEIRILKWDNEEKYIQDEKSIKYQGYLSKFLANFK